MLKAPGTEVKDPNDVCGQLPERGVQMSLRPDQLSLLGNLSNLGGDHMDNHSGTSASCEPRSCGGELSKSSISLA